MVFVRSIDREVCFRMSSSPRFFDRRSINVKAITRGTCNALIAVGLLCGMAGCSDNQSEAENLAKKAGDPGPPAGAKAEIVAPAKSQKEHFERGQAGMDQMKKATGAKR